MCVARNEYRKRGQKRESCCYRISNIRCNIFLSSLLSTTNNIKTTIQQASNNSKWCKKDKIFLQQATSNALHDCIHTFSQHSTKQSMLFNVNFILYFFNSFQAFIPLHYNNIIILIIIQN